MVQGGDKTNKFFHQSTNAYKRYNHIDKLKVQRETIVEPAKIKEDRVKFCSKLYTKEVEWRSTGNINNCPTITEVEKKFCRQI